MGKFSQSSWFIFVILVLVLVPLGPLSLADNGPNHQVRSTQFGVSGGNINDISKAFCCSGTLGSLVQDSSNVQYILSNNHVLADSDTGKVGDKISQPGLVDVGCNAANAAIVANLTAWPLLGSNVDAAIAQLIAGQMDSTGYIMDIGTISNVVKTASVGLAVAKSGRTTGFTTGSVQSVNTSVSVQYQKSCGAGKKSVVSYSNQVVVTPGSFSAGGDSGSLIVTNDACHQPVALLFAGSSTSTIGNPIGVVLAKVGSALGKSVSFVGTTCGTTAAAQGLQAQRRVPSREAVDHATEVMKAHVDDLMSQPSIIGVGVGAAETDPPEAAIVIYVDVTTGVMPRLPKRIDDVAVKMIYTDPFIAF